MRLRVTIFVIAAFVAVVAMLTAAAMAGEKNAAPSAKADVSADVRTNPTGTDNITGSSSGPIMMARRYERCRWVEKCVRWRHGHCVKRAWVWRCLPPRYRW